MQTKQKDIPETLGATNNIDAMDAVIKEKLIDAMTPGFQAEFDPDEADLAGAFIEDALTEEDAIESDVDLFDTITPDLKRG